jgi:hypothetical protein
VDLAERGDGERLLDDVVEQLADAGVEVLLDHASHPAEGDGPRAVGQRPKRRRWPLAVRRPIELDH